MQTDTRFKRGNVREDGMVFWEYKKQRKNSEYWVSKRKFDEMRLKNLLSGKKYRESDRERYRMLKRSQFKSAKEKDPEKFKETRKITHEKYRKRNRERLLPVNRERMQKWRTENPELAKAMQNKWIQNNKHRFIAYNSKQRARRKSQTSILNTEERLIINEIYNARKRISDCTGIQFHVDHIYPLSKGGLHKLSNLQLLPAIINIKKGNKLPCSP
jgi:hypothetical protein